MVVGVVLAVIVAQGLQVVGTLDGLGPLPRLLQSRQKHGGKDGDDGDDHQKFDQRKFCGARRAAAGYGFHGGRSFPIF